MQDDTLAAAKLAALAGTVGHEVLCNGQHEILNEPGAPKRTLLTTFLNMAVSANLHTLTGSQPIPRTGTVENARACVKIKIRLFA